MFLLWIFWLEILAFSFYALWSLWQSARGGALGGYQWADVMIYGLTLAYGLYGFIRFASRRLKRTSP
ncbi:MAG: hypothetical protein QXP01_04925 [Candidatus Hadarchaeum sp.]